MKRLYNIDSLKFLCAVLVIFLHVRTPPIKNTYYLLRDVPFHVFS